MCGLDGRLELKGEEQANTTLTHASDARSLLANARIGDWGCRALQVASTPSRYTVTPGGRPQTCCWRCSIPKSERKYQLKMT